MGRYKIPVLTRIRAKSKLYLDHVVFIGASNNDGYGQIGYNGKVVLVHRVYWEEMVGPIPEGMCILHKCDYPPCFKLEHLFLGTRSDNTRDMYSKDRNPQVGEANGHSYLTREIVLVPCIIL